MTEKEKPLSDIATTRHPLELVSLLAQATAAEEWDRMTPEQQSEHRMQVRHLLQGFAHAGLTEAEAASLVRYYQPAPEDDD